MNKLVSIDLGWGVTLDLGLDGRWTSSDPAAADIANLYMVDMPPDYRPNFYLNVAQELAEQLGGTVTYAPEDSPAPERNENGDIIEY